MGPMASRCPGFLMMADMAEFLAGPFYHVWEAFPEALLISASPALPMIL